MKHIALITLALLALSLPAQPQFYPMTTLAENCLVVNNTACDVNNANLAIVLDQTNRSQLVSARLYHASGELTNPSTDQRFLAYNVTTVPTTIINGSIGITGSTPVETYLTLLQNFLYLPSPLKMQVTNFDPGTGQALVSVTKMDPNVDITGQDLVFFLVEDNVGSATNVTRQVLYQDISLPQAGVPTTFSTSFTVSPAWIQANLWVLACVQLDDMQILQTASSLPLPQYSLRCAFDWDADDLEGGLNASLVSEPFYLFNTGATDNYTAQIVVEDGPADWYFNFCDEEGNCYPGNVPLPFSINAGEFKAFHLNLWIASTGTAHFYFQINSTNSGTLQLHFTARSDDVSASDLVQIPALRLEANQPNPFAGATSFRIASDKALASATIQIFNLKGQLVDEAAATNLRQGTNNITWQAPSELPAGVYFYRLSGERNLRRMLLLK